MQSIGIVGWYGHDNIGDESYKLSFPILFPQYNFQFLEQTVQHTSTYILGGGDVVSDHFLNILEQSKNKHIMSATISKADPRVKSFQTVAVRDSLSISNAAESGANAIYVPDFAFMLNFNRDRGRELIRGYFRKLDLYSKVVAVVINSNMAFGQYGNYTKNAYQFENFSFQLAQIIDNTSASFLFIPFGTSLPWDDRATNAWVASKCKFFKKNAIVYDKTNVQDTIDIISACDSVISTRLHSSIFSCVTNTPFVDIVHNHKNKGFLDAIGMKKLGIHYNIAGNDNITELLKLTLSDDTIKEELASITIKQKRILRDFSKNVCFV